MESLDGSTKAMLPTPIECNRMPDERSEIPTVAAQHHDPLKSIAGKILDPKTQSCLCSETRPWLGCCCWQLSSIPLVQGQQTHCSHPCCVAHHGASDDGKDAKHFVEWDFYVDDGLKSFQSPTKASDLLKRRLEMLAASNLRLQKIASNNPKNSKFGFSRQVALDLCWT